MKRKIAGRRTPTSATRAEAETALWFRTMTLIADGAPLDMVLEAVVQGVEARLPGMLCSILLLDDSGERLVLGAAPSLPEGYTRAIDGVRIGPSAGACGAAAFTGRRVIVADIQADPVWTPYKHLAARADLASCWSEPILARGAVLGAVAVYHRQGQEPEHEGVCEIEAAAYLSAIAIEQLRALKASEAHGERAAASSHAAAKDLETFFQISQDLLSIADAEGRFINLNQSWHTMLGYPPDQLVGMSFLDVLHPDDVEAVSSMGLQLQSGGEITSSVSRCCCADGTFKHIEWSVGLSGDRSYCIGRDVSGRIETEMQLTAARVEAEAANRAKTDFLANMSHEVRTPLNGVIGIVDVLAQTELSASQRDMVKLIQSSGATLERLVSDILDISKIEAGRCELEARDFDLRHVLGGVLDVARNRAEEKGLAFRLDYGATAIGLFHGDGLRLRQILDNLISNAVKFTGQGEVAVRIDVIEPERPEEATRLSLEVRDTGVGFDASVTLFERFSQADTTITRRFGGSGLGLAIVKGLVETMGGEIHATSRGQGAIFSLLVPLPRATTLATVDQDLVSFSDANVQSAAAPDQPLRILLAEDNPTNQKVVDLILSAWGAHLTIVENGAQAVEAFKSGAFDVVLMDMQMPVMDGLTAIRALRAYEEADPGRPRTSMVILSANAMVHHRTAATEAGADLHIPKPVTAHSLIAGIQDALRVGANDGKPQNHRATR